MNVNCPYLPPRHARRLPWLSAATLALLLLVSCEEGGFDDPAPRPVRPASTPLRPTEPAPAATRPAGTAPEARAVEPEAPVLFQLVLLSEPGPARPPASLRHVDLEHATARPAADLLAILCIPAGPTGSLHRYSLLYPTRTERDIAAGLAMLLDVPPITDVPSSIPDDAAEALRIGIGLIYAMQRAEPDAAARLERADACLTAAARADALSADGRWAAAMIAGALKVDRSYDYPGAQERYRHAEASAVPGSYMQMAAIYAHAAACAQQGDAARARNLLARVLSEFDAFRQSEVFDRARRLMADLERR